MVGICFVLYKLLRFLQMLVRGTSDIEQTEFHKVEINLHTHTPPHFTVKIYMILIHITQIQMCNENAEDT